MRQRDILRIIAGSGIFRRHGKRRIHLHFALRNFYGASVSYGRIDSDVKPEVHYIPILHNVLFAFKTHFAGLF